MFQPLHYLRMHVYPRGQSFSQPGDVRFGMSGTVLGMVIVMLMVILYAYILTLVSARGLQGLQLQPEAPGVVNLMQSESGSSLSAEHGA